MTDEELHEACIAITDINGENLQKLRQFFCCDEHFIQNLARYVAAQFLNLGAANNVDPGATLEYLTAGIAEMDELRQEFPDGNHPAPRRRLDS